MLRMLKNLPLLALSIYLPLLHLTGKVTFISNEAVPFPSFFTLFVFIFYTKSTQDGEHSLEQIQED